MAKDTFRDAIPRTLCTDCGLSRTDDPGRCGQACQFIRPDYPGLEAQVHGRARNPEEGDERFFGPYKKMYRAWARKPAEGAQWSGLTTRIAQKLLETGAVEAVDIRGRGGLALKDKWKTESKSIMGVCIAEFPNLFTITGPQAPFANLPTSIEQNIQWITDCIKKMESDGYDVCIPQHAAEEAWVAHTAEIHEQTLMAQGDRVNSWMMGANIENKNPRVLIYFGGANVYYDKLRESVDSGFPELEFDRVAG